MKAYVIKTKNGYASQDINDVKLNQAKFYSTKKEAKSEFDRPFGDVAIEKVDIKVTGLVTR